MVGSVRRTDRGAGPGATAPRRGGHVSPRGGRGVDPDVPAAAPADGVAHGPICGAADPGRDRRAIRGVPGLAGPGPPPSPGLPPAVVFVDISGYTSLTER